MYDYTNDGLFYEKYRDGELLFEIKQHTVKNYYTHFHFATEICYVKTGYFDYAVNEKKGRVEAGEIFFVNSCDVHQYFENDDCEVIIAIMNEEYSEDFTKEFGDVSFDNVLKNKEVNKKVFELLEECFKEQENLHYMEKKIFANRVYSLLCRNYLMNKKDKSDTLLSEIMRYIYKNYNKPITLDLVAEKFSYSKSTISKLFQQRVNVDFRVFVSNVRADKARQILHSATYKGWNIIDIAMECGFTSLATFYRTYKRRFGCSPEQEKLQKLR